MRRWRAGPTPRPVRAPCNDQRPRPLAVRNHEHLPLPVRAGDDRARLPRRPPADRLVPQREARVQAPDALLRHPAADQRRRRSRHRAGAGVRVRDELVGLLALRGRRVRRPAGDGGASRVLPGVHLPGAVAVRLGPAPKAGAPRLHLAGGRRDDALGDVHHGRQLVDAAPGGLHAQQPRPARTERHRRAVHQPDVPVGLRPRDPRRADNRSAGDARGLRLAAAQGPGGAGVRPQPHGCR